MTQPQYLTRAQLPRQRLPLRRLSPADRSGPIPTYDGDYSFTADHLIDDPREPNIVPIGLLDERGEMLLKVHMPIKVKMGFALPPSDRDDADEVVAYVPESQLIVSDIGLGQGFVTPKEADEAEDLDPEDDEDEGETTVSIRIPATESVIAAHGAMQEAAEAVADQVTAMHVALTPEGLIVLRGLASAQTDALIAFLQAAHAARQEVTQEKVDGGQAA
ncbi:hypothetical protein D869_gp104 [Caulobacter phage CcrRogue]|uniref:Uncharacterized protein n=1 Tax=Caulobacter phage CcrRogue TaxID=2927986 RepID=K4JR94_9CAUD|nr:hypothetical protein D869_gp104 [Caulobacter phage CcrRogue]AFU86810.1 hypothetical protein CcrRogue_gp328 [Caulobacter phage CcrRogue]